MYCNLDPTHLHCSSLIIPLGQSWQSWYCSILANLDSRDTATTSRAWQSWHCPPLVEHDNLDTAHHWPGMTILILLNASQYWQSWHCSPLAEHDNLDFPKPLARHMNLDIATTINLDTAHHKPSMTILTLPVPTTSQAWQSLVWPMTS